MVRLLSTTYEIATARCYESALAQAEASPPDAVISDIGLPGRDGLMLMRELSRRYGVPGIAVSGHRLDDDALRDAGFVAHLLKPIVFDHLLRVLAEACASGFYVVLMSVATRVASC